MTYVLTCPRCQRVTLQENLAPPFGSWCPCGFTVPEVQSPSEFGAYIALERNKTPPVIADRLPSDVDLRMAHWRLELGLRGSRTVEEARVAESAMAPGARAGFEGSADRRTA